MEKIRYRQIRPDDFSSVIALGNHVHGDNYLDPSSLETIYAQSICENINLSWVAYANATLIGFRLTLAAPNWQSDEWCTPQLWGLEQKQLCYFKCNTVAEAYRGQGIGSQLLAHSIETAKALNYTGGLAHIWLASPGNSAYRYFTKCGAKMIKEHPNRWQRSSIDHQYHCPVCGELCECVAAEMLLEF